MRAGLSFLPPHERPPITEIARAFMRYLGQGHEIAVEFAPSQVQPLRNWMFTPDLQWQSRGQCVLQGGVYHLQLSSASGSAGFASRLRELFEAEYKRQYSREIPDGSIEVLSWGLTVSANVVSGIPPGPVGSVSSSLASTSSTGGGGAGEEPTTLELWDTALGASVAVPVYQRATLASVSRRFSVDTPAKLPVYPWITATIQGQTVCLTGVATRNALGRACVQRGRASSWRKTLPRSSTPPSPWRY